MANCTRNLGVGKIITQITLDYFMPGMGAGSIGVNSFYVWKTCKVNNISWQIYGENEIINVVEFNYHHCVTSSKLSKDAKQLLHTIAYSCGQGFFAPSSCSFTYLWCWNGILKTFKS
ncbi:hypothetical protein SUGI_0277830 [Cryptomeria japonica]|nr:hypothetical protein SUGI_0277830 [Cryptomeria japonica]